VHLNEAKALRLAGETIHNQADLIDLSVLFEGVTKIGVGD
jgi:hypothetical protein